MKKLLSSTLAVMLSASAMAQTADWLVTPQFADMKYFAPKMYKVTKDKKVGIIGSDGKTILKPEYDAINLFYEGRAVFVDRTPNGWLIKGVLSEDGTVNYAEDNYYLLPKYMFYSEGLLTVRNEMGQYGYLDEKCQPAFDFTSDEVRPFSEGFAVVGEGDTFHWINTAGEQILPRLKNGGTPYGGTNFHNGKAYLWDEDGVFFTLDDNGKTNRVSSRELTVDYLYRVDTDFGDEVPYASYSPDYSSEWTPEERGGKWTYISKSGKLLTPFQYEKIEQFADGSAMAEVDGVYGLLQVVEDHSTFYTTTNKTRHVFSAGGSCTCDFTLAVPEKWKGQDLSVSLKDAETGKAIALNRGGQNRYSFAYRPSASRLQQRKSFRVEVKNNGISLWQGEEDYVFEQRAKLQSKIRVNNADANQNDRCYVTATVSNPSGIPITTTVTLSGGGNKARFDAKTVTITIPPHSSKTINSSFFVKNVELNGWCSVSTSEGTSARKSNLELKPF